MNNRNDLLFVSIHGAFMTFDPLSCTSNMSQGDAESTSESDWGGLVWNRRKRPVVSQGGGMRRQRQDNGWMRKDGNRPSANTGWVRGVNPNWDSSAAGDRSSSNGEGDRFARTDQDSTKTGGGLDKKPRKVSDLASFLSALVLFGPTMTHMTH